VEKALQGVSLLEIVQDFVDLVEDEPGLWWGVSPHHEDSGPDDFVVLEKDQIWECHVCQSYGDAIGFMMNRGLPFIEALEYLERRIK
jgi:DNA primase